MAAIKFPNCPSELINQQDSIKAEVESFLHNFTVLEKNSIYVLTDLRTNAFFCELHIPANTLINNATIDVPLDPENQAEYRANREAQEDHTAYQKMLADALAKRTFSNIVCEYNISYEPEKPIKIIGGQHRFLAIEEAISKGISEYQGIKIYFSLDKVQRLDVQLISNTNIAVSSDLLDRMFETSKGPELRNWCHATGLLALNEDFADKKQRGSQISVKAARTFMLNYFAGREVDSRDFDKSNTIPVLAKTGVNIDEAWEQLRSRKGIWTDVDLLEAGKEFAKLNSAQSIYFKTKKKEQTEFSEKALAYSVLAAWAYVAGILQKNPVRLTRHYSLALIKSSDPLSANELAKAKHKTDPENYRGLGTRTEAKERGRMAELFYLQTDKGTGFNKNIIDLALKKFHAKQAYLEMLDAERKLKDE